ncbi:ureidoglycolate lyase [Noviherbaspirillum galbum]|uniref:Ureidoglycolate lyase n=1 Tax=Noviherbaspirillum galbum TaxID=2709383 RepID=A0A6B3SZX5_9BURK|nr:ureidoglycolate lyase [Noviherbaspirillum galbum]NEX64869.1 ureidoglycolate lyase [Noviherbaspirillum galbum]
MRELTVQNLSKAAFAPFGVVIDAADAVPEMINDGTTRRHADLASLDIRGVPGDGDPRIHLYVASARRFPLRLANLERHRRASQVFVPLNGQRFIVVVAPGGPAPEWERIEAFLSAPGQAISLHRDCWHHGLIALQDGDRFAVIEGGSYRLDTQELAAPEEIMLVAPGLE